MTKDTLHILNSIAQALFDKKGHNIIALDLREVTQMTDFFVIAEGTVNRHVKGLAKAVLDVCEQLKVKPWRVEGMETGDWVVLDFGDFMIHLLLTDLRSKYALEELWHEADIVDVNIKVPMQKGGKDE